MENTQAVFMERMQALAETGRLQNGQVSLEQVREVLEGFELNEDRVRVISQYLSAQKIIISGVSYEEQEQPAWKEPELTAEEQEDLEFYRQGLPSVSESFRHDRDSLFARLGEGDAKARELLMNGYLSAVVDLALSLHEKEIDLSDLIQEGNLGLVMALEEPETDHQQVLATIQRSMEDALSEVRDASDRDRNMVGKVNRLKDAIEQLSDGEEMDFTIGELALFLDMTEEEIRDTLNLTGEKS